MPSTIEITELGQESNCMECHQGRASLVQVMETINDLPSDAVDADLNLPNLHNNAAGATYFGTEAKGGAEYIEYP